jgi:hypothetical protein
MADFGRSEVLVLEYQDMNGYGQQLITALEIAFRK